LVHLLLTDGCAVCWPLFGVDRARLMRSYVDLDTVPQQDIVVDYGLGPLVCHVFRAW